MGFPVQKTRKIAKIDNFFALQGANPLPDVGEIRRVMSFRLVPNSVTLDDLERRNSPNRRVISPNSVAFGADYVKVVEDTPILSATEM